MRALTRRVVEDIDREGRPAARVGIKVRYRPFFTVSRSLTLPAPSNDPAVLADAAVSLLDRVERDRPVRLLGVRLEMVEPEGGTEPSAEDSRSSRTTESTTATRSPPVARATARCRWYDAPSRGMSRDRPQLLLAAEPAR